MTLMFEEQERAEFEEAFTRAQNARRAWELTKRASMAVQEREFAAKLEYYEATRVLDDARVAWDKAEKKRKKDA